MAARKRKSRKIKLTGDINADLKLILGKRKLKPFQQFAWVRPDCGLLEVALEDVSCYHEWIKGEGGDISVWRANDDDRVVGVTLPLRNYKGLFKLVGSHHVRTIKESADEARQRVSGYSKGKRKELLAAARQSVFSIPAWRKPPIDVSVQSLREFMSRFGADVSVLVTWTHETGKYQFITIGADQLYADSAVNLRNLIAAGLELHPLDPKIEDLRGDHPNMKLNDDQIQFLLWTLGRLFAEKPSLPVEHRKYITRHHNAILELLHEAKSILDHRPS